MNKEKIIAKFIKKEKLSYKELNDFFNGYLNEKVTDEEMTIVLKNICKNGMTNNEIFDLVDIFIKSGEIISLKELGICVDKHSTGGVGDKTTLIVAPIVASCGVKIAKASGRALGHTGGTIDKLESIKIKVNLTEEEFISEVKKINMAITSQTANLCPMDKKVYALRDVTNTTSSIPLIASSIMSKKIASGADKILIDIKVGNGALITNIKDANKLAKLMIAIGKKYNREVRCMLTRMDNPLGDNIGNSIEILEVLEILENKKKNSLYDLCIYMATELVSMGKNISTSSAKKEVLKSLKTGEAYNRFLEFVKIQHGNLKITLPTPREVYATENGYIKAINSLNLGKYSMSLGAGRITKEDKINYNAGIILNKNIGKYVKKGDLLCSLYGNKNISEKEILSAYSFMKIKPKKQEVLIKIINN